VVNYRFEGYPNFKTYQRSLFLVLPTGLVAAIAAIGGLVGGAYLFHKKGRS